MRNIKTVILAASALFTLGAFANEQLPYGFLKSSASEVASMAAGGLIYSYDMRSSLEWDSQTVSESNLFGGFKSFESWNPIEDSNETIIYASEVAFVVNKVVSQDSLSRLASADFLSSIDPGFSHEVIEVGQANSIYQDAQTQGRNSSVDYLTTLFKKGKISELEKAELIERIERQYQVNMSKNWCEAQGSECLKSVARIPAVIKIALAGASSVVSEIPESVEAYSQLMPMTSEQLSYHNASAGVLQVGFLSTKVLVSLKNIVLATHLGDGSSLITIKTYAVMEKDDLDKFEFLGSYDAIVGNSYFNLDEGIAMGLPLYSQRMAEALREKL